MNTGENSGGSTNNATKAFDNLEDIQVSPEMICTFLQGVSCDWCIFSFL